MARGHVRDVFGGVLHIEVVVVFSIRSDDVYECGSMMEFGCEGIVCWTETGFPRYIPPFPPPLNSAHPRFKLRFF